ncbi:PASTA domain-containing protein [Gimesia fumaroli]|uniref:PASTA domain protein n=1 Tax=Gimesia fumaroli TaxID=2527976 RepID=A0A518IJ85_9PLAN|nr:PASTA domain-containing protein [Gimesia fumaroli]QDV53147.1 PASTA domain protein [Gimesia fumaroli]
MKSKLVLQQRVLVLTCCTALMLLLMNNESQAQLEQRKPRPNPADAVLKVQQLPPALEQILKNWETHSKKIEKLEGNHVRLWYDDVFQMEKRSEGKFYYEQPDKGRIDITGMEIKKGAVSDKKNAEGKPYQLKPGENERWICDGARIFSINEDEKSYEVYPIPLGRRGENIMEGPLPFLFGMPAETAKKRYFLQLVANSPEQIVIAVKPRRRADAANYREAKVILNPKTYLPNAVLLVHPGGNQSTVYVFKNVVANKSRGIITKIWGNDPFKPDLDDYQLQGKVAAVAQGPNPPQVAFKVPSTIGRDYKAAQKILIQMGFKPEVHPGNPAQNPGERKYHVYRQKPQPGTAAKKGDTIHLLLYTDPNAAKN